MTIFVELDAERLAWGIESDIVSEVVPEAEWKGAEPADLGDAVRAPAAAEPRRVLVVQSRLGQVAIRAAGRMILREVEGSYVLDLPALVRGGGSTPGGSTNGDFVFDRVVLREGEKPLLVIDPEAVFARHARHVHATKTA